MGNSVVDYRAAIGLFYNKKIKSGPVFSYRDSYLRLLITNLRCSLLVFCLCILQTVNPRINIVFLLYVLHFLLLIGTVHPNPGPMTDVGQNISFSNSTLSSENYISICSINIRSIRNKLEFLNNFFEEFDLLAVSESHIDKDVSDNDLKLDSFSPSIIRKDRNNYGGGVMIYAKNEIILTRKTELENPIDETVWVEVRAKGQTFLLCHSYRPPNSDVNYWTRLNHAITLGLQVNGKIVVTGDLNSDLFTTNNNRLIDTITLFNLYNTIEKPTRITDHSSTLLDPIIISDDLNCIFSDVFNIPREVSDHDAPVAFIECPVSSSQRSYKREIWYYDQIDKEKFNQRLLDTNWNNILSEDQSVDELCEIFTTTFLNFARECIPTKLVTVRNNDKPWFNGELRREIRIRDRLRKKAIKSKRECDLVKYKRQRNRVNNLKKGAKEKFEANLDNLILENIPNSKNYWKIMKMLIKSNKSSTNIPPLQNIVNDDSIGNIAHDDVEKCSILNKYFCTISQVDDTNVLLPEFGSKTQNKILNIQIEIAEIIDIIKILNPNKASGPDLISHKMLKMCPEQIAIPLQIIFNRSLRDNSYPSSWKTANVTAIFKKGDSSLPSNYRPISLISCVGKVLERIIFKHVYNHLFENKLIYRYQSGFLPKYSTVHQLLEMYNCILNSLEKKEISCFVFCDFSKAFDKIWHRGLLHKMKAYGIDGNLLHWFENYLCDRKQKVVMNNSSSAICRISAGVPQGSVLGPLLFIIYINDIAEKLSSLCRLFADDTSFGCSSHDGQHIKSVVDRDLKELDEWSAKWLMSFNPEKTEIMIFSNVDTPDLAFSLNNYDIPISKTHKHLGVTFSSDAKWNNHVDNIIASVTKHLNVLRKLKYQLCRKNLEKMYLVFIRPMFEYASEVWDNCGVGYSNKLESLQLEAARIVTGLPVFTKIETVYQEVGWEPLYDRRKRRKLQMFYNIQSNNAPDYLRNQVPPCIQSTTRYPLRNGQDIIVPFCRLSLTSESFFPSTIREWNKLDLTVRNTDSPAKFKSEVRKIDIPNRPPPHFSYGPRKLNILLTQLRCSASFLNYDLYRKNIITDPSCDCGENIEDIHHFLFECRLYANHREILFNSLHWLPDRCAIDIELLTRGNSDLSTDQNIQIFKLVQDFIKRSNRFLIS